MKYICINKGNVEIKYKSLRRIRKHEVLIKTKYVGLCGSDLHKIHDRCFLQRNILGHEIVGEIISDSEKKNIGKYVAVNPLIPCKNCVYCKKGETQLCINMLSLGRNLDGGFGEFVIVPKKNILILDDIFSLKLGVLIDPIAVVIHGINMLKKYKIPSSSDKIAIFGDGTIGLSLAIFLHQFTSDITIFTKDNKNSTHFPDFSFVNSKNVTHIKDETFDIIFECVGGKQSNILNQSFRVSKRKGIIMVFSVFPIDYKLPLYIRELFYKEILLIGSNSYGGSKGISDFKLAYEELYKKQEVYSKILGDEYNINDFKYAIDNRKRGLKTIFYF